MELKIIEQLRREKKLSKSALAKRCGVSRSKIMRMEYNNEGKWQDVVKVMKELGFEFRVQLMVPDNKQPGMLA